VLVPRLVGHVLDVGAGAQPYRRYLATGCSYVSMDISHNTGADIVGSVLEIPQDDDVFDGIICTEVIEHVNDPKGAIVELHRVSRSGAFLYLTAPMSWGLHYEPYDYFRYTKYGLTAILEEGGFRVLEVRQIGGVFVMAWARITDALVSLVYRVGFPLKYLVGNRARIAIISLMLMPFVVIGDLLATVADAIIPGSRRDALGWAVLAENTGEVIGN
jgi:SAM-dependent methyltransferase